MRNHCIMGEPYIGSNAASMSSRMVSAGPLRARSSSLVTGVVSGLISTVKAPLALACFTSPAAGETTDEVPITKNRSHVTADVAMSNT